MNFKREMHPLAMIIIGGVLVASLPILAMLDVLRVLHIDSIMGWILLWGVHVGGMIMGYIGAAFYVGREKAKRKWAELGKEAINDPDEEPHKRKKK